MAQKFLVRLPDGEAELSLELDHDDDGILVRREGEEDWRRCELERVGRSDLYLLMIDSRPTELYIERRRGGAVVTIGRHVYNFDVGPWRPEDKRARAGSGQAGLVRINAPMTGSIVEVRCSPGQVVSRGDVLLVIESMKMNNELRSPADGTVETVSVSAGQRVNGNELLVGLRTGDA